MKPKERFINYALLSSNNCEPAQSSFKEDIPIDLSIKKPIKISNDPRFDLYQDYEHAPFHHLPHIGEWPTYCYPNMLGKHYGYPPNAFPYFLINSGCLTNPEIEKKRSDTILDPLLIPYHIPQESLVLPFKLDPYGNAFKSERAPLSAESASSSSSSSPSFGYCFQTDNNEINENINSKLISSNHFKFNHLQHLHHQHSWKEKNQINYMKINGSQQNNQQKKNQLRKALSFPCLLKSTKFSKKYFESNNRIHRNKSTLDNDDNQTKSSLSFSKTNKLFRSKSECNLHLIIDFSSVSLNNEKQKNIIVSNTPVAKNCAPKKLFASNYYRMKEESIVGTNDDIKESRSKLNDEINIDDDNRIKNSNKKVINSSYNENNHNHSNNHNSMKIKLNNDKNNTRFYRNYRKDVIHSWDNERRSNELISTTTPTQKSLNCDVLDLRKSSNDENKPYELHFSTKQTTDNEISTNVDHIVEDEKLFQNKSAQFDIINKKSLRQQQPLAEHPLDFYRQYYYYLIQEPTFASRAAVAVAETYAKLLTQDSNVTNMDNNDNYCTNSFSTVNSFNNKKSPLSDCGSMYETKRTSPDCSQSNTRTELRSADTTNGNIMFDRKRISRPLTGKHVRHGTGASPSTLVSLRNMIQQRQKLKEISKVGFNGRYGKNKMNKRIKRK